MDDAIAALTKREGWRAEGAAARVHYTGGHDDARFAIEYYAARDGTAAVLYWRVPADGATATPVPRASVPTPLRKRIRDDLAGADVDPDVERREL